MKPEALLANVDFVKSLARSLLRDEHLADDVAQETWLAALKRPPSEKKAVHAWLKSVARNISILFIREENRRSVHERAAVRSEEPATPEEIYERETIRLRLMESVLALKDPYRTAIMLRYYEDLPPREIARRLDQNVENVKTHLKDF